jgi:hypothetical protein
MHSATGARADAHRGALISVARRPVRPRCFAAALAVLAIAVTACTGAKSDGLSSTAPPTASAAPHVADAGRLLVPSYGAMLGAWVQPSGAYTPSGEEKAVARFEHIIGRRLAIDNIYTPWAARMPLALARWDLRGGTLPMISWSGASTARIAAGAYDAQLRAQARQLRSLHRPVMVRWFFEMEGGAHRALAGSPASFIAAWRHIHEIFTSVGATNVLWVWCPNASDFTTGISQRYYPGNGYVDWIGADGYNWSPVLKHAAWRSFGTIFSRFYQWGIAQHKPLIVGETGVMERRPGEKAAWFRQADQQLRTEFPAIRAVVYFNSSRYNPNFGDHFDWKVTSSPSALNAFRALAAEPYFGARPFP